MYFVKALVSFKRGKGVFIRTHKFGRQYQTDVMCKTIDTKYIGLSDFFFVCFVCLPFPSLPFPSTVLLLIGAYRETLRLTSLSLS
jgi:hypothetical protein